MPIPFTGLVVAFFDWRVLVYGPEAAAFGEPLFGPPVFVRPGYRMWSGGDYLLPAETIDDIGQRFRDQAAYEWIEARGDAYPRADAIGIRPSGQPETVFMKELDLAVLAVFAADHPGGPVVRLDLAIEALAVPDGRALSPVPPPPELALFDRALPWYRLSPGAFGALGAGLVHRVLASGRRDITLSFDNLDDLVEW